MRTHIATAARAACRDTSGSTVLNRLASRLHCKLRPLCTGVTLMRFRFMLIFAWPCLLAAGQDTTEDRDRLQGVWQAVSIVDDGEKAPDEAVKQAQMVIKG